MIALLKAHFYRMTKTKTVWFLILPVIICLISQISMVAVYFSMKALPGNENLTYGPFFRDALMPAVDISGYPGIFLILFLAIFVGQEWKPGTMRNQVGSGYNRNQILWAYQIFGLCCGFALFMAMSLCVILVPGAFGIAYADNPIGQWVGSYFLMLLIWLCTCMITVGLSFLTKSRVLPPAIILSAYVLSLIVTSTLILIGIAYSSPDGNWPSWYYPLMEFFPNYQLENLLVGLAYSGTGLGAAIAKIIGVWVPGTALVSLLTWLFFKRKDIR